MRFLLLLLLTACYNQGIVFYPDFYIHDSSVSSMTNEEGKIVYCSDDLFNEYASMHYTKIKELSEILKRAKLPREMEKEKKSLILNLEKVLMNTNKNMAPVF